MTAAPTTLGADHIPACAGHWWAYDTLIDWRGPNGRPSTRGHHPYRAALDFACGLCRDCPIAAACLTTNAHSDDADDRQWATAVLQGITDGYGTRTQSA